MESGPFYEQLFDFVWLAARGRVRGAMMSPHGANAWRVRCGAAMLLGGICILASCGSSDDPPSPAIPVGGRNFPADGGASMPDATVTSADLSVTGLAPTSLGTDGFTPNGQIHPHGLPTTYYFEYGRDAAYGMQTAPQQLGPRLGAYYHEGWNEGVAGWAAGTGGADLRYQPRGGALDGYVRYSEYSSDDKNHADGIGYVHLTQFFASGTNVSADGNGSLGGGDADFRDAKVSFYMRGTQWVPHGSELIFWLQSDLDLSVANDPLLWRKANWAYTGNPLTDFLFSGKWEKVEYRVRNDTNAWTYGGRSISQNRPNYVYWSLNEALQHANCDFIHILHLIRTGAAAQPTGSIDYDEFDLVYRNRSLLVPSNGATLMSFPRGSPDDAATLTDGWRFGAGRSWRSAPNPAAPLELVYQLANPVTIKTIQIHQHPEWPSRDVEVFVSDDGTSWRRILDDELAESAPQGPNLAYLHKTDLNEKARYVKIVISSGWRREQWGLGEIEMFGTGAVMGTDNDWYTVNQDILNLTPGATYHYRLVAKNAASTLNGNDQTFTVPATAKPETITLRASRIQPSSAKVEGRLNAMGLATQFHFEYGKDTTYGSNTVDDYGGVERSPRVAIGELAGLQSGTTYHFRLVATSSAGTSFGADQTLVTK